MRARSSEQEDYLLRIIRQISEAIARLRELLTGSVSASVTVRDEVRHTIALLLGEESALLMRLDPESAARLVGSPRRVELWATLLDLDADACARAGDEANAAVVRARAVALRAATARLGE